MQFEQFDQSMFDRLNFNCSPQESKGYDLINHRKYFIKKIGELGENV